MGHGITLKAEASMNQHPVWRRLRWLVWGGAAGLLMLPAIAMRFTSEVDWNALDFVVMGVMLGLVCASYEVAVRVARSHTYVLAAGLAVGTAFVTTWINLAVGIVGVEGNPVNVLFFAVLAIGLIGVLISRLEAGSLARAMLVTAGAQGLLAAYVLMLGDLRGFTLTLFLIAPWLLSARLFAKAAGDEAAATPTALG